MTRHFIWFAAVSARNRARVQLRRLRSPRYAIAALVGLAYFILIFGDWGSAGAGEPALGAIYVEAARRAGPLVLGLLAAWWWLWGGHRFGLVLTPAETHFLVPAPLTRAALVRFKVLQAQFVILVSATLATILTRGSHLAWPLRLLSLWTLLATLHQHQIAASLVHAAAAERGRRGLLRVWPALLFFSAAAAAVLWSVRRALADIRAAGLGAAAERVVTLMDEPAMRLTLAPFRLVLQPLLATSAAEWATAFAAAVVVLGLHYLWLQRTDAAFEEVAAGAGAERDARAAALQAGGFSRLAFAKMRRRRLPAPLLRLRPTGHPAYAVFWKNVLYVQRLVRPLTLLLLVVAIVALAAPDFLATASPAAAVRIGGIVALAVAAIVTVGGPFAVRNDLRLDLAHITLLRTLPLRGRDVVAAEIAAAAAVVSVLQVACAATGLLLLAAAGTLAPGQAVAGVAAAPLLLPPLVVLGVTLHNALALLYPGWMRAGSTDAGGIESVGQNVLILIATLVLFVTALLPALLAGAAAGALLLPVSAAAAAVAGAVAGTACLLAETALLVLWLGRLFDGLDAGDVIRAT